MNNNASGIPTNGQRISILPAKTITTALTADTSGQGGAVGVTGIQGAQYIGAVAVFTYGSGGTTTKAWLQTSFDGGVTWHDIASFAFALASLTKVAALTTRVAATHATPTDGTLADNTINNGLIGGRLRVKITSTGTYAGSTTLRINLVIKG